MNAAQRATTPTAGPQEDVVEVDGHRLRLLRAGAGPVVLYLHGVGDLGTWIPPLTTLANSHTVLRPDHPGFNGSDDVPLGTPAEVAALYSRLFDVLALVDVTVVGCSFGGWIATELALREPRRVSRLLLIDPAGMPAEEERPRVHDMDPVEAAGHTFSGAEARAAARARAAGLATTDPLAATWRARNTAAARRLAPASFDPDLLRRAAGLTQSVLILWGEDDGVIPVSHARSWTDAIAQAELSVVPDCGHLPHLERPEEFIRRTRGFWPAG